MATPLPFSVPSGAHDVSSPHENDVRRTVLTGAQAVMSTISELTNEVTDAFFCGSGFSHDSKVRIVEVGEESIEVELETLPESVMESGTTCSIAFLHRGIQVLCVTQVHPTNASQLDRGRLRIAVPKFLSIREFRSLPRTNIPVGVAMEATLTTFGRVSQVEVVDVSTEGARVRLGKAHREILKVGDVVRLQIGSDELSVDASGAIRWIRDAECGMTFAQSSWETKSALAKLVAKCVEAGAAADA